ncbi:Ribonuclease [Sphingomonas sp. EC-HK361]|uniref:ribonuclease n=1 Tax=Sphingomonas sp. EC-HK361 TaxID=2038397 RepID=UPI0012598907|nr:ribonuclease [Sphingomonas sp. EC-HK361]VVT10902.1 Ribonuclease [Sphingomonas sp. EC-HK361]
MPEWLYEAGIGEARAALVDGETILAARIEPAAIGLRVGTIAKARLIERISAQIGLARLNDGRDIIVDRPPAGATLGSALTIEVVREAIPEPGRPKLARARVAAEDAIERDAPALLERITASPHAVRMCRAHEADALETAGWSEVLEEARTGDICFALGALRLSPTPAMTLFDVDGPAPLGPLAVAAARAVAAAIDRHDIGGSIGIDFPTLGNKAERQAVADALDATLAQPFERTAVNGFGFLQIVRPRPRASLPEFLRADPIGAAARAVLRTLERTPPGAVNAVRLPAAVIARIDSEGWRAELERRTGVVSRMEPNPMERG